MDLESVLRAIAAIVYFATFVVIASYKTGGANWRPGVSAFAVVLAGSSFALSLLIVTGVMDHVIGALLWALCLQCLCVLGLVVRCHGNLAKLLPNLKSRSLT